MWKDNDLTTKIQHFLIAGCLTFGIILVSLIMIGCDGGDGGDGAMFPTDPPVVPDETCNGRRHMCNTTVCDQVLHVQCSLVPQYEAAGYRVGKCANFPSECLTWNDDEGDDGQMHTNGNAYAYGHYKHKKDDERGDDEGNDKNDDESDDGGGFAMVEDTPTPFGYFDFEQVN